MRHPILGLSKEARDRLEQDDPEALRSFDAKRKAALDLLYPEPTLHDLSALENTLSAEWSTYFETAQKIDDIRYARDETPEKWARHLEQGRRVRARLTHNEILRVVAMLCRNPYKVGIPPSGPGETRDARAKKQERFANEFLRANERRASAPLRRKMVDCAAATGLAAWEIYLTDSYDSLELDNYKEVSDEQDGQNVVRQETETEYLKRTEESMMSADMPICVRFIHSSSLLMNKNDQGVEQVIIKEKKPYRQVYDKLTRRYANNQEKLNALRLPKPGTRGWPINTQSGGGEATTSLSMAAGSDANGDVDTWRYYDARWYVYVVGGVIVDGPREHGLPGIPVIPLEGIVTSSPNNSEQYEGITWGMADIELGMSDMITLGLDTAYTYSRPRPAIETDVGGQVRMDPRNPKVPAKVDFSDPHKAVQLLPGQHVVDAYQGFQPKIPFELLQTLENLWQRSGRNPVAQGSSPGSDVAGYTLNSLMGAADDLYGILLDNDARAWGQVIDFVRDTIKYTIGLPVYIAAPGTGKRKGQVEWLSLSPDDIDDTPAIVTIDPTTEANRLAKVNILSSGWKDGVVPRRELQEKGYGAEDPSLWDDEIIEEMAVQRVVGILIDNVLQRMLQAATPAGAVPTGPQQLPPAPGAPELPSSDAAPGAGSAPTVGAAQAQASQGAPAPGAGNPMAGAIAGQNNGYTPPPGQAASGPRGGGL